MNLHELAITVLVGLALIIVPLGRDFGQPLTTALWVIPLAALVLTIRKQGLLLLAQVVVLLGVLATQWGLVQFALQSDLGLLPLGEEQLDATRAGVAKFSLTSSGEKIEKVIRAYGPFGHPNILGAALASATVLLLTLSIKRQGLRFLLWYLLLLGTLLTFSRLAWTMFFFGSFVRLLWRPLPLRAARKFLVPILITLLVFTPLIIARVGDAQNMAVEDRSSGYLLAHDMWSELDYYKGVGIGKYTHALREHVDRKGITLQPWELQPVHSVPLFALIEWGVIWTVVVAAIILSAVILTRAWSLLLFILVSTPLWLFDHFLLTDAGGLLWWLVVALVLQQVLPRGHLSKASLPPTR